ncbi:MAG: 4Fe-4S binding protein [Coriobacteriales bacterium]|jgi:anaerobic dimethyl sulfoxide reductase subunit B (iron-sulfur subunit)|nr:4Fe-4S binding protein [Coriobacteriales bacterium]
MTQNGFYFDSSRCTGCKTCELACKDYKDLGPETLFRKIYDFEGGTWTQGEGSVWTTDSFVYHVSAACNHCVAPACQMVCPAEAILRDEDTGLVYIDLELCINCELCVTACPYSVPKMDIERGIVNKCDGCLERVTEGKKPICVEACPLRALDLDDIATLRSSYGDVDFIPPLPEPSTGPNLVISSAPAATSPASASGFVANMKEVA